MLAALTRGDVADYMSTLFFIYTILILIRILMSWVQNVPYNAILSPVLRFVEDVTEPYLGLFRRLIPMARIGGGAIDLSPIVAILVLNLASSLVVGVVRG